MVILGSQTLMNDTILEANNDNQVIHPEKIFQISNTEKKGEFEAFQDPKNLLNANMEAKDKKDTQLGKRTFSQTTAELKKKQKQKEIKSSEDEKFGSDYEVGDCLMSVKGNDLDENY